MSKITKIKEFKFRADIECNICGTVFEWFESSNMKEARKFKNRCPTCKQEYALVFAPQKVKVIVEGENPKIVSDFFQNKEGDYT